jgi:hypothetical protein
MRVVGGRPMSLKEQVYQQLDWLTDRLSTQVRTLALGTLVLVWGVLSGDKDSNALIVAQRKWHLMGIGGVSVLVLMLDYLQYVAAYFNAQGMRARLDKDPASTPKFKDLPTSFNLMMGFFWLKQVVLCGAVIWLMAVLGNWLWEYR